MGETTGGTPPQPQKSLPRIFPRYRIDVRVVASVERPGGTDVLRGRSTDISQGGMGATLAGELTPGEMVKMEFSLPFSRTTLHLRAVVRRRNGLHYGLEFHTLSPEQREAIRRLCEPLSVPE